MLTAVTESPAPHIAVPGVTVAVKSSAAWGAACCAVTDVHHCGGNTETDLINLLVP